MNKEILTLEEASELFGVSIKTFIKLLKEERVPARKIGREWRFSRKALIDWLSSGDSQSYSSSEGDAREFFNNVAGEWESIRKGYDDESIKRKIFQLDLLKPEMTAIDLGAGSGYISRAIAGHVAKVIAVDISAAMLKELGKRSEEEGFSNIDVLENDGRDMSVAGDSADLVFASMFLHHLEKPETAVQETYRVLKPGGTVFVADFSPHENMALMEEMHDIWQGFQHAEIKKWFKAAGFQNIRIEALNERTGRKSPEIFVLIAQK